MEKQRNRNVTETKVVTNVIEWKSEEPEKSRLTKVTAGIPMKKINLIQLVSTTPYPNELSRGEPGLYVNVEHNE